MIRLSRFNYDYLSPVAGILLALAFAPLAWSYLAIIALILLFFVWEEVSPGKAAWRGFLFGLGLFGSGVSWVFVSVYFFGGANIVGSGLLTLFFVIVWACFPALTGYLTIVFKVKSQQYHYLNVFIIPAIWMLIENFRGYWLLNGFPWFQLAYSQVDSLLSGYVPLLGVYGTGYLLAFSAAFAVYIIKNISHRKLLLLLLLLLWVVGGFLARIQWTHTLASPFNVALVQGNIAQDQKWVGENRLKTLLKYKQLTQENWDAKVIVWPETSIPAFLDQVDAFFLTPLEEEARKHQTDLVVSLPIAGAAEGEIYNGVLTLGQARGVYRKNHLLPFGEYLPLQPLSGWVLKLLGVHLGNFSAGGADQPLLRAGGYKFATSICYEDVFGGEVAHASEDAAYLVNVTNDAWFGNSLEPHQHMQMARMRALETGRYMLRVTNTGVTAIVGPDGKIIKQAPLFEAVVLKGEVTPMAGATPYASIGDTPILGGILLLLGVPLLLERFLLSVRQIKEK